MNKVKFKKSELLLHTCCAPCLAVAAERLKPNYDVIIFWYNPNIEPEAEHQKRFDTLTKFLEEKEMSLRLISNYDYMTESKKWHQFIAGLENEPEGGKRCQKCIEFRLNAAMKQAEKCNFDLTATTLTVSPYKDADMINKIGKEIVIDRAIAYQITDFGGDKSYQRSIELSKQYGLYRQKYCGCRYSRPQK